MSKQLNKELPKTPPADEPPGCDDDPKKAAENERKERRALEELHQAHVDHSQKP